MTLMVVVGALSGVAGASGPKKTCALSGDRTLVESATVRVVERRAPMTNPADRINSVFACYKPTRQRFGLGGRSFEGGPFRFRIAGRYLAFQDGALLIVVDASRQGRELASAVVAQPFDATFALGRRGAAIVGDQYADMPTIRLLKPDGVVTQLAASPAIDVRSIAISSAGDRAYRTEDGKPASARLGSG